MVQASFGRLCAGATLAVGMVGLLMAAQPVMAQASAGGLKGDPAAGARKNSMCIGCHSIPEYKTAFPVLYRVPKIAGQNEAYLVASLQAYKNGDRSHPSMKAISASLTDQDMADLAAFYARLSR
jgi:cytochrome c553